MSDSIDFIASAKRTIDVERAAVAALGDRVNASFAQACRLLLACRGRIVVLGMGNSRMKDYFDLLSLIREARMAPTSLTQAITATFARRATPLPAELPIGLTATFALDKTKRLQWRAFLDRSRLEAPALEETVAEIAAVVSHVLDEARR